MDTYFVNITEYAEEQLKEIVNYITNEQKENNSALQILKLQENEISTLTQLPQRIVLVDEEPWHSEGIHKMVIRNFIAYFWIDESQKKCTHYWYCF